MNLYKYLKETALLNQLKDTMLPNFYKVDDAITDYLTISGKNNAKEILDELEKYLNLVSDELENLGYTYNPEVVPDEDENVFRTILKRYKDEMAYFINNFNEDQFESFNVQTKYIINLIEVHKLNFN